MICHGKSGSDIIFIFFVVKVPLLKVAYQGKKNAYIRNKDIS